MVGQRPPLDSDAIAASAGAAAGVQHRHAACLQQRGLRVPRRLRNVVPVPLGLLVALPRVLRRTHQQ